MMKDKATQTNKKNVGTLSVTLPGCQKEVSVRGLTVGQLEKLSQAGKTSSLMQVLKEILTSCTHNPSLDLDTTLACDCNALLLAIRRATFGEECDFLAHCPVCEKQETYTVDLSELRVRSGNREIVERQLADPQATHSFAFPFCEKKACFRLTMGKELFSDFGQDLQGQTSSPLLYNLLQRLCKVEGLGSMPLKVFVCNELSAGDAADFLEYYIKVEPGYEDKVHLRCCHCTAEFEDTLILGQADFFRRSRGKKNYGKLS